MTDHPLSLPLSATAIDNYCRELTRRLPSVEKRIAAVDAIRTFLAVQIDTAEQASPAYAELRDTLERHFEQARGELQKQQVGQLVEALEQKRLTLIGRLYQSLSRDAFWQLMTEARERLGEGGCDEVASWAAQWVADVERRSAQLSPYPDAIDFKALGIEVADYTMMCDISRCFASL